MSKKIFGLLLVVCLVVGLLPVVASAAEPADATLKFGFTSLKLTGFDTPVYTKNVEKAEAKDAAGNTFVAYGQTTTGATEENYNAKYEWKTGEEGPTLILRNFKFDEYNNDTEKLIGKVENGEYTTTAVQTYSITTSKNVPTKIILEGDNLIEAKFGITFYNDLTIESKDDGKLTMYGESSCIAPNKSTGNLTINANLNLTLGSYYNTQYASAVIHTYGGNLTINGGTIKCKIKQEEAKTPTGISAKEGGNLIINGGNITATSIVGQGATNGCITAPKGKLIINGGVVNANPKRAVGLYALNGIEINGGEVNVMSPWYGINVGNAENPATVVLNGGTLKVLAERCFYGGTVITVGENVRAFAGPNEADAEVFDGTDLKLGQTPWWLSTDNKDLVIETKPAETLPSIPTFTDPTTAPDASDPTTATPTTAAPSTGATPTNPTNGTQPADGNNNDKTEEDGGSSTTLIIVIAAVVVVAAAAVVVIIKKRKAA